MIRTTVTTITLSVALIPAINSASAQDLSLEQCQKLQSKIERYTDLRRAGGRAQQMEKWKSQRNTTERKFKEGSCRKYGRKARE